MTTSIDRDTSANADATQRKYEADGTYKRPATAFRDTIAKDGPFSPEKDRYVLYASLACPWAHRCLIVRELKGLQDIIPAVIVSPRMGKMGWPFANSDSFPKAEEDRFEHAEYVQDLYKKANPDYSGRYSVPVLWDLKGKTIVSNESSEIIRMLNTAFNDMIAPEHAQLDLYPTHLAKEIDDANVWVYDTVNNGVYKTGAAQNQEAYEKSVFPLFDSLDRIEGMLKGKEYFIGDQLTEADVRLYTTIVRFDPVYHGIAKCNLRTIRDGYPNIHRWVRKLYWTNPAFGQTTDFDHIKLHYWWSLAHINPSRVVPAGPIPHIFPL